MINTEIINIREQKRCILAFYDNGKIRLFYPNGRYDLLSNCFNIWFSEFGTTQIAFELDLIAWQYI